MSIFSRNTKTNPKQNLSLINKEQDFLSKLRKIFPLPLANGLGIGDDAAFIIDKNFKEKNVVVCVDSLAENIHFRFDWCSPMDIAHKLVEVNVSDFYAKGAVPLYATLAIALTRDKFENENFKEKFFRSLKIKLQNRGIHLVGGDTSRAQSNVFTLNLFGYSEHFIARKYSAQCGDKIWQIGPVGGSFFAMNELQKGSKNIDPMLKEQYTRPQTPLKKPLENKEILASIDQSDSVFESLMILAAENNLKIKIIPEKIKISQFIKDKIPNNFTDNNVKYIDTILSFAEDLAIFCITRSSTTLQNASLIAEVSKINTTSGLFYKAKELMKPSLVFDHFL